MASSASAAGGLVRLGTATVNITPPVGMWLGGYAARQGPSDGIHDDLYGKVLVFGDGETRAAIITVDLLGFPRDGVEAIRRQVEEATGIPGEHLMVTCSHTHSGPVTGSYAGAEAAHEYVRETGRKLGGAVHIAAGRLRPVTIGYGDGLHPMAINRRRTEDDGAVRMAPNPEGPVDRTVPVVRLDEEDGRPAAVVFGYACHASVMGGDNYAFSGDYPGAARRFVESVYGADNPQFTAAFTLGCAGDIKANVTGPPGPPERFRGATFDELGSIGRSLGAQAVQVREGIAPATAPPAGAAGVAVASKTVTMPLRALPPVEVFREGVESGRWPETGTSMSPFEQGWARRVLERLECGERPPEIPAELQAIRVGPVVFISFPGEIFTEIGMQVRARVRDELGLATVPCTLANGGVGYVPTATEIPRGGYEFNASRSRSMAGYSGESEPLFVDTALALARAVSS